MLDAYIIDKIRRERESREIEHRAPRPELPVDRPYEPERSRGDQRDESERERGVVIIDLSI